MQTQRLVSTAATILGLTLTAARADIYMELGINKRHYQTGGSVVRFDHGELNLYVRDGLILLAPCSSDPELFFYGPHLGCALGITGYVAWGDFNRDGVSDANQYWSIDRVVPAVAIAPSFPQLCSLVSAPPSKLPRPLRIFRDGAVTVFHDLRTTQVTQYELALYEMVRRYGSVRQVETLVTSGSIVTAGTINVTVTGVDFPAPVLVEVPIDVEIDEGIVLPRFAEEWAEDVRLALQANAEISAVYTVSGTGNAIILTEIVPNGNDATLRIDVEEGTTTSPGLPITSVNTVTGTFVSSPAVAQKQMKEELVNGRYVFAFPSRQAPTSTPVNMPVTIVQNVEAFGANPRSKKSGFRFTSGQFDEGFYQVDPRTISTITWTGNDATNIVVGDQIFFSIMNPAQDRLTFPPTVPQAPVVLATPAVQSYTLPPGFYQVGDEGVIEVRYQRTLPVTPITYDRSRREFRMPVKFIDTYPGYAQRAFPLGTAGDTSVNGDFDRDGMSNIEEYAYQFPSNAEISAAAKAQFTPANTDIVTLEEFSRVIEEEDEPIAEPLLTPDGPVAAALDDTNHIVFKVPYRAHTGTSLRYDFVENTTNKRGKVKSKKIKPGAKWEISFEDGDTITRSVHIEVKGLDPITREVQSITIRPTPMDVNITQRFIVLRSKNPVKNPAAPLPTLAVKITPIDIR